MAGFDTMHAQIVKIIRQIAPRGYDRDRGFISLEGAEGAAREITDVLAQDRLFDVRMRGVPYDAGYTGLNGVANRVELEIRVRYGPGESGDRGRRTRKAGVDGGLITNALLNPNLWDSVNSGINTIVPPGRGDVLFEEDEDEEEGDDTLYLKIALVVEYLEQN